MHTPFRIAFLAVALAAAIAAPRSAAAQDLHPTRRLSPVGIAKTHIGNTYVKVTYGRPYTRGRAIFGAPDGGTEYLVPFGQVWRTGANEATEITVTGPVRVAGELLEAGTYSIFTEPGPDRWVVHFSPQLGLDGTGMLAPDGSFTADVFDPARDVLVIRAAAGMVADPVDPLTFDFVPNATGMDLVLRWETTEVRIPLDRP